MLIFDNITTTSTSNTSWVNNTYTIDPSHTYITNTPYIYTTTTTGPIGTTFPPFSSQQDIKVKRCRNCKHAHIEGQKQCVEVIGQMVTFVTCSCDEYVPEENLEYLEWKYKKNKLND